MDNFEFLRTVTIGQYLPTGSWIHRLDARARILGLAVLLVTVTVTPHLAGVAVGLAVFLLLLALARIPYAFAIKGLLPPLPFLLILAALQALFPARVESGPVYLHWGWVTISAGSLLAAARILLRFFSLILGLSLGSYVISTSEMIRGLESLLSPLEALRLPVRDFVMAVQVMLRFIPFLALSAERIAKGQASRGAEWGTGRASLAARIRQAVPLIVPLFLTGLRKAETLALSMEARGYGNPGRHTSMAVLRFTPRDALVLTACLVLSAVVILV